MIWLWYVYVFAEWDDMGMIWDDVGSNLDSDDSVIFSSYQ